MKPGTRTAPARTFTEICREYLAEPIAPGDERTRLQALVMSIYAKGMKGDHRAACVILDRVDPAPSGHNITINNNLRAPIVEALERLGVDRVSGVDTNGNGFNGA